MDNKRNKGVVVGVIVAAVLVLVFGVTFALWTYSNTLQNQELVAGDIFMKYSESKELTIEGAMPKSEPGVNDYFEFTIEGRNKYSKPIWYEIVLNYGADDTSRKTRIKDNLLMFRLVETKDGVDTTVLDNATYSNLKNKTIWVNTIPANQNEDIVIKYKLYMWISPKTNIGNVGSTDYSMEAWIDVFASIKVNVNGDFNEKEVKKEIQYGVGTEALKGLVVSNVTDTCTEQKFDGGLVAINQDGELYNESSDDTIREYRYSGPNVDNYIYFNCQDDVEPSSETCEVWRIIGIFKDEDGGDHLKITYNKAIGAGSEWNSRDGGSDWSNAKLEERLNTTFYDSLSTNAKSMIAETKYYLGNVSEYDTAIISYNHERGNRPCSGSCSGGDVWSQNQAIWNGNIALMYPSDYGYTVNSCNWTKGLTSYNNPNINSTSWLYETANHGHTEDELENGEWFLSPVTDGTYYVSNWDYDGRLRVRPVNVDAGVYHRPTLSLISSVKITSGDGSLEQPYFLEI